MNSGVLLHICKLVACVHPLKAEACIEHPERAAVTLHGFESMIYTINWLALCLPAVARRVLSLGGLEACERVLASGVRLESGTSRNIENLRATLLESTRPPKKARAPDAFDRERERQTRLHLGWPEDLEVPLGDLHTVRVSEIDR